MTKRSTDPSALLTSAEAAAWLGIKRETLYAYVSRGLVKGQLAPTADAGDARGRREKRYRREDLEPLRARSAGPAASALRYGEPVLDTRITRMTPAGPAYRGRPATDLVREGHSFEAVAELLWSGELPTDRTRWGGVDGLPEAGSRSAARGRSSRSVVQAPVSRGNAARAQASRAAAPAAPRHEGAHLLASREFARLLRPGRGEQAPGVLLVFALALPLLAAADPLRFDAEPVAVTARARQLIPQLAASVALALDARRLPAALDTADPVLALARALGVPEGNRKALELLRVTLILCADHELNASTFAARVAASTGASLHACLSAALAAFSGPRHGGASEQVEWLVREAGEPARAAATVGDRLRRGERLAGFGHPLYPGGDPRVPPLLESAVALAPRSARLRTVLAVADAVHATGRPKANIDVAIAAACAALDLPLGLGPALFAIGRMAGWVANVLEQQASPAVLRPRARFVGEGE